MWKALEPTRQYSKEIINQLPRSASWSLTMLQERLCLSESPKQSVLRQQGGLHIRTMFTESAILLYFISPYKFVAAIFLCKTCYLSFGISPKYNIRMTDSHLVLHFGNDASNVPLASYLETDGVCNIFFHIEFCSICRVLWRTSSGGTSYISKFSWSFVCYVYLYWDVHYQVSYYLDKE